MSEKRTLRNPSAATVQNLGMFRALVQLSAVGLLSLFVAGPTAGNVGGCGGTGYSTPIPAGNLLADPPETPPSGTTSTADSAHTFVSVSESAACSVRPCSIHLALSATTTALTCLTSVCVELSVENFSGSIPASTAIEIDPAFALYEQDAQVCGDAVMTRSCVPGGFDLAGNFTAEPGTIGGVFAVDPPTECTHLCPTE